jgi:prephenate dehydratase
MMTTRPRRIVFQGEPGANSHMACRDVYPDFEPVACATFEDAFQAIADGSAALGMIPIENSVAGRVADIHHLMPTSGLHIIGEYFLPLHHYLLAAPGASLQTVKTVHSHVMALGQCRKAIRRLGLSAEVHADTAGAARMVAELGDPSKAAIASRLAAEIYGLEVLESDVEDEDHNTTRFVVMSKEPAWAARGLGPIVTTFIFRVRNVPAALYKAMGGFATNGVNMTKLESYQLEGEFFATQFFADIEGHPDDPNVTFAFEELAFFTREFRILGVYRASPFRERIKEPKPEGK